jgi:hypothetical protein
MWCVCVDPMQAVGTELTSRRKEFMEKQAVLVRVKVPMDRSDCGEILNT